MIHRSNSYFGLFLLRKCFQSLVKALLLCNPIILLDYFSAFDMKLSGSLTLAKTVKQYYSSGPVDVLPRDSFIHGTL